MQQNYYQIMSRNGSSQTVRMVAKDENGKITYAYHTIKNIKTQTEKLELKKYNPVTRKAEKFVETKVKKG